MIYLIDPQNAGVNGCVIYCPKNFMTPCYGVPKD
jgi:hypothetical protein